MADDQKAPLPDERAGYVDFFSHSHANRMPCVYPDGSITWPPTFTPEAAAEWRAQHGLTWPGVEEAHRQFDAAAKAGDMIDANIRYFDRRKRD